MKLPVGARLPHDFADIPADDPDVVQQNRALYRITHILSETPWSCLYRGKKVFRNFEFSKGTLIEAADDECLDVLIRTLSYPRMEDREYVKARREHSLFEAKRVLGCRRTNLIAEPLDYLEIRNDQDHFAFPRPGKMTATEPVLILESIHGDNLARWRQSSQADVSAGIQVLGQMLEFVRVMHDESFLLNVVSPATFWVDPLPRVHFLGTDNVVDDQHAASWRSLFPGERYAQGFVAPELLRPAQPPTRQSDLYGWAALAWFLLTGDSPAKLAADQQQRWARFEPSHRERLKRDLGQWTSGQIAEVKREFGITGSRFEALWPDSLLDGLWSCFDFDPALRPSSVFDLRAWWQNPPPPPVPACLAILQPDQTARILFSTSGLPTGIQYRISRQFGQPPRSSIEGEVVWRGHTAEPVLTQLPPRPATHRGVASHAEWRFSVFTIETLGSIASTSHPTAAITVDPSVPGFRRALAESLGSGAGNLPEEILLLCELDSLETVADELIESAEPAVRRWGIALLERSPEVDAEPSAALARIEALALEDDDYEVRLYAAGVLLRATPQVDQASIANLAQRLGNGEVDDMIRIARSFETFGAPPSVIEAAIESIEAQHRFVACPECSQELRARQLDPHLRTEHKYVEFEGRLLPFGQALTRLWSRVLKQADAASLSALCAHLLSRHGERAVSAFGSALSQQVLLSIQLRREPQTAQQQQQWFEELARCLRMDDSARAGCGALLSHDDGRIRALARMVALPQVVHDLSDEQTTVSEFRHAIDQLVPTGIVAERIETCRRLVDLGANPLAGELCERELELDHLVDCPECGTTFRKRELGRHRRSEHRVFEWEGNRYTGEALMTLLLDRAVSAEPDVFAARNLEELFIEEFGKGAWQPLFMGLRDRLLQVLGREDATAVASGIGAAWGSLTLAPRMARLFLNEQQWGCRMAALAIVSNLDRDPPADLLNDAIPLLADRKIPDAVCRQSMVHLLRRSHLEEDVIRRALRTLASRAANKLQGVDLLRTLEQWVGPSPVIEAACEELISQIRMRCPRCSANLPPPELADHLIKEHNLVLDGRSVRKPWSVAVEYLEAYGENPQSQLLERAEHMASIAQPQVGRVRLMREALRRNIAPVHYRRSLVETVTSTTDTICPHCWETIPTGEISTDAVTIDEAGNLLSEVVSIKRVGAKGFWSSVEITPWDGPDPRWTLAHWGGMLAVGLPFFGAAAACLFLASRGFTATQALPLYGFVAGLSGMAVAALVYWNRTVEPVDVAWELVVPRLLDDKQEPFGVAHSAFLASLAKASCGRGTATMRQSNLGLAIQTVTELVKQGLLPAQHLAELWHLRLVDAPRLDEKRVKGLATPARRYGFGEIAWKELLSLALRGEMPLDAATHQGTALAHLNVDGLIAAFWHLIAEARWLGMNTNDLAGLFRESATLKVLVAWTAVRPKSIPHYFAVLAAESAGRMPAGFCSAKRLVDADGFPSLSQDIHLLARSDPQLPEATDRDTILLRAGILEFRGCRHSSTPVVVVEDQWQFNPAAKHRYSLKVHSNKWEYDFDPTPIMAGILKGSTFLFGELQLLSEKLERAPASPKFSRILTGPLDRCPSCHHALKLIPGNVSLRAGEPTVSAP